MKPISRMLFTSVIIVLVLLAPIRPAFCQNPGQLTADYIKDRFDQEQRRILRYEKDLGLSSRQVEKIKMIKINLEKEMILMDARIEVINLDLRDILGQNRIDMNRVKKLLTDKYDLEKQRVEGQAAAYASLKEILTAPQQDQLRTTQEIFRGPYGRDTGDDE